MIPPERPGILGYAPPVRRRSEPGAWTPLTGAFFAGTWIGAFLTMLVVSYLPEPSGDLTSAETGTFVAIAGTVAGGIAAVILHIMLMLRARRWRNELEPRHPRWGLLAGVLFTPLSVVANAAAGGLSNRWIDEKDIHMLVLPGVIILVPILLPLVLQRAVTAPRQALLDDPDVPAPR